MPVNADLQRERDSCPFDTEALTLFLDGSTQRIARRREISAMVESDPVFSNADNIFKTRPERFASALRKARRYEELRQRLRPSRDEDLLLSAAINETLPTLLHYLMFMPNIRALCTDAQQAAWLPRCESLEVIGCYAQTELGHGSNIRALETTATFLPDTDEFEIHSPTLTATKWWPGTLGRTANHAMVIAQLVIGDRRYGIHNFIVPLRDVKAHAPLRGVRAGDIGPKIGFTTMDNGYCVFDRVRVPRANMAARYASVDRHGVYTKKGGDSKISYITMMQVRAYIVEQAGYCLAKATTIAVRYSALRRQGFAPQAGGGSSSGSSGGGGSGELQVLDYTVQMHRLLPLVATAYAFHSAGRAMQQRLARLEAMLDTPGVGAALAEFHASSSGLKSLCSAVTADGIEDCRKCCGGHGYLAASGLPELLGTYLQNCTVEGENHMLTQQTVKHLLKAMAAGGGGGEDCGHLSRWRPDERCCAATQEAMATMPVLMAAFEHRAARLVAGVGALMRARMAADAARDAAWNGALVEMVRASRAHAFLLVLRMFAADAEAASAAMAPPARAALQRMVSLFALYWMERDMGDFTEDSYLSLEQATWVRGAVVAALHALRPAAVGLVDAWDFTDHQLGDSALGRRDGNVYAALMSSALKSSLNARDPVAGYEESLRPLITSRL
ncbi:oxidase precursor [Tribonema minus]|uniref:Acyl-coenzyme A oxidase n=1 Tax=Tribonema minus TaxID=303371 RepID=A0A835YNL1_9STRA|nr:oxidase precursor [Tribonema minus]